jgi:hypothetical protein
VLAAHVLHSGALINTVNDSRHSSALINTVNQSAILMTINNADARQWTQQGINNTTPPTIARQSTQ